MAKYKKIALFSFCVLFISIPLLILRSNIQNKHDNSLHIDKNNIVSFKISNIIYEKEIKNKLDRDNLIDLINSIHITKTGVDQGAGCCSSIIIKYSNGKVFSAGFLSSSMTYSFGVKYTCCDIDKDIVDDLRNYYDKTLVGGIDNNERKITEIVPPINHIVLINYNDINKIIFKGNINKTVEDKETIKKIMNLIDSYVVKQAPQEFPINGFNISAQFFIDDKDVLNINFMNPMVINGKSYEEIRNSIGDKTINDFLNSLLK